ncbi:hypothetical protein MUJ63_03670 [Lachnospiraceae bacterium NSJ-143]|nr:hypothetical protein [Lachnospiraceae bacterium NSJ-143]
MSYRIVDDKGRILFPAQMKEMSCMQKIDVVQKICLENTMITNKAALEDVDPIELLENRIRKEKEEKTAESQIQLRE